MTDGEQPQAPRGLAAVLAQLSQPRADGQHPLLAAAGGVRGIVDSALPTTAFILAITVGSLRVAAITAVGVAAAILLLRLVRREPIEQACSGLVGVAVAALVAYLLDRKSGFFLPGLLLNIAYAAAILVSVAARRPFIGYIAAIADTNLSDWRERPLLRRAAVHASLVWAAIFVARLAVQGPLYLADRTGWLGVARLAMGWPLWGVAVLSSFWLIRRAIAREVGADPN
ncbi:MAG TPA: DUF3159 domain-containing protein [Mycobacteriales bacterium]|nr:DUF3159 domain-containing protein [Mycobacteriales bacterium]